MLISRSLSLITLVFALASSAVHHPYSRSPRRARASTSPTIYRSPVESDEHTLRRPAADITLVPQDATRSIVFELNGSLHVDSVEKDGKALTGFVQDAVGAGALGPNVR